MRESECMCERKKEREVGECVRKREREIERERENW